MVPFIFFLTLFLIIRQHELKDCFFNQNHRFLANFESL